MRLRARSAPNIAFIKYWGNRNNALRLPAADSLSMMLDGPSVEVSIEPAEEFSVRSFNADESERSLTEKHQSRFERHLLLAREYLEGIGLPEALPSTLTIEVHSEIPSGIGIASSSAIFSAVAEAFAGLAHARGTRALSRTEISITARLGSGSAARSTYGGYVGLTTGPEETIDSAYAIPIAPEDHWLLYDVIIAPTQEEKQVGSTEGHALARTSPLFADRLAAIPRCQQECIDAVLKRDFEKLQRIAEEDCWSMHAVMQTSTPPLRYLTEETHRIVGEITELRERHHLPVLYTMDAGPTVHVICTEEALPTVREFAHAQKGCLVIETMVGEGSKVLAEVSRTRSTARVE
jgi:diphosphomevalonate decarboxylase